MARASSALTSASLDLRGGRLVPRWAASTFGQASSTTHPNSHPVCRRPTRMWSGRGAGRPGGARHCTNDLDARCRVCSACPGPMADGMGVPPAASHPRAGTRVRRPVHPGVGAPPPEACWCVMALLARGARLMPLGLSRLAGAGVGAARAERAAGRSVARSGAGKPARRSVAEPGALME